jgi:hypothetical protein
VVLNCSVLLGDRDEEDRLGIDGIDQLGEVGKRTGSPLRGRLAYGFRSFDRAAARSAAACT